MDLIETSSSHHLHCASVRAAFNGAKTAKGGEVKAKSTRPDMRREWSNKKSRRWLAGAVVSIAALFASNLVNHAVAAGEANACQQTAADALAGCQKAAQSDYKVALGKCVNISDPATQKDCQKQAATDLADALQTCQGGLEVRQVACQKVGPAPYDPVIDPANFTTVIDNPYFPLTPGTTYVYETKATGEKDTFEVTHNTRVIDGVKCVQVHDSVSVNGEVTENTLDWHVQDKEGNVWYFGENTAELENGLIATIEGSFMAGVTNDKPGIIMKAQPAVGDFYRQEFSLGNAEDFAETLSLNETVIVPAGTFTNCLKSRERSPLEPDVVEDKFYAPGVGNVLEVDESTGDRTELVQIITE
jgi:hypothetical protein